MTSQRHSGACPASPSCDQATFSPADIALVNYRADFVPPAGHHKVKKPGGKNWREVKGNPTDRALIGHLSENGAAVACVAPWYVSFSTIDFDEWRLQDIEAVRHEMKLHDGNSMLFQSESADSYHLLFKPSYGDTEKPITSRLLHDSVGPFIRKRGAELYPQIKRTFRLPFGHCSSRPIDDGREWLKSWTDKYYWAQKLDAYDIGNIPVQFDLFGANIADLEKAEAGRESGTKYKQGEYLYTHGIQTPRTREQSQFAVLYYLWRRNLAQVHAVRLTKKWIRQKHNGQSRTAAAGKWREIDRHIEAQAAIIWETYTLPDVAHNFTFGHVCRNDIPEIIKATGGSMADAKFFHRLLSYYYPRRNRETVRIHRDRLRQFSHHSTLLTRIERLAEAGIIERGTGYAVGHASKSLRINWKWKSDPLLDDGRSILSLDHALTKAFSLRDVRQMFESAGASPEASRQIVSRLSRTS